MKPDGSLKPERVFVDISDDDFEKYRLENDDLVIARTGATVGKSFLFHGTDDFVFASYLIRYRFDKSKLFSSFLHYVLQSSSFWKFIGLSQSGGAQPNVNATKMSKFDFYLPPLPTQKNIVAKLDQKFADWESHKQELQNIQNQHELIKKHLNSLSSSILNDAFSGKLVN